MAEQTAFYRRVAPLIAQGDFYRLADPFETDSGAWMFVSKDKAAAFAVYVRQLTPPASPLRRLRLAGLDPDARYAVAGMAGEYGGDELMFAGLPIPPLKDFEALSFTLERIGRA